MKILTCFITASLLARTVCKETHLRGLKAIHKDGERKLWTKNNIFSKQSMMMMGKKRMMSMYPRRKPTKGGGYHKPAPKPVPTPSAVQPDSLPTNKDVIVVGDQIFLRRAPPTPIDPDPVQAPTAAPSDTSMPSPSPSQVPTASPSDTLMPSPSPSSRPSAVDADKVPSTAPTETLRPSPSPSMTPSASPSQSPSTPTTAPTETTAPSPSPSSYPTVNIDLDICQPITCPSGQSCDPLDGTCRPNNALRPCIAVIDESSLLDSFVTTTWRRFRTKFPDRPFCLLQPQIPVTSNANLFRPPLFETDVRTTFSLVNRDNGNETLASDWAGICGISGLAVTGIDYVALFVDTSWSMTLDTVGESYNQFLSDIASSSLTVRSVGNANEDWITPFIVNLT